MDAGAVDCDILVRAYWRDFDWLELCLRSVERYCAGFHEIIIVLPHDSRAWLKRYPALTSTSARIEFCPNYEDDYLGQQVTKLHADEFSQAAFICHLDADCILRRKTVPDDLLPDGKPRIYTKPVAQLPRHWPWLRPTREFLGITPSHDFLQCPPFTFPRWLYGELRAWTQQTKGVSLSDWVLSRPARGFSEFNALAAYAYEYHPEDFIWTRAADIGTEERHCAWYWSWGGLDSDTRREIERLLGPPSRAGDG